MEVASDALDFPIPELATPEVLRRGRIALAAPNAEVYGAELYPEVPAKAVALAGGLLANPLPGRQVPRIACQVLRGFLRRNEWTWTPAVAATILRFQSEMRTGEVGPELEAWILKHAAPNAAVPTQPPEPANGMRLFTADDPAGPHVVYQAGPVTGLNARERELQLELGSGLEEAAADASERTGTLLAVEHPSVRLSPQRSPATSDHELWQLNRMLMLSKADALVAADIGEHGLGVGATMEIELMASQGGPILYLRRKERGPCSRYFSGRGDELDLSIREYGSPREAYELAQEWFAERVGAIEEAGRRRVDRVYEGSLLLKRLLPAYRSLHEDRKMFICGSLGISPTRVQAALQNPAATSIVLGDQQTGFCELVGLEEGISGEGLVEAIPNPPRADTLIEASKRMQWNADKIQGLWSEAVNEWETVTSDRRFPAQSMQDWIERGGN
jgi:hypothetical protein